MEKQLQISPDLYYDERSAGGIVFKIEKEKVWWLVVKYLSRKSKKTAKQGVVYKFPKGHLKEGEVLKQAALREVEEEGRVKAKIVTKIGSNDYIIWDRLQKKKIIKKVTFFLMEYQGESNLKYYDTEVILDRRWMDGVEATEKLAFDSEKVLLGKAKYRLERIRK